MKQLKHITGTLLAAVGIFFGGCNNLLDIPPEGNIVEDDVFSKASSAEGAVAGTYHLLLEAAKTTYELADATTPMIGYNPSNFFDAVNNGSLVSNDGSVENIWEAYYAAINQANLLIFKIKDLGTYEEDQMAKHIAEAKFIRAFGYLNLLAWFGDGALIQQMDKPGVVLYLDHYDGYDPVKDKRPRDSNGVVYAQIIKDLEEAMPDLPETANSATDRASRANVAMCEALLSRVYLYMHDYENAADYSQKLLAHTEYKLVSDFLRIFPPNENGGVITLTEEHVFAFPVSSNGGNWQFGGNGIYYHFGNQWFDEDFLNSFNDTDKRITELTREAINNDKEMVSITNKFPNTDSRDNLPVIRLPEIMLIRAESIVRNSEKIEQDAIDLLNEVYLRANPGETGYKAADFTSAEALINTILDEKSKELIWEGVLRFEQMRTGRSLYNPDLAENKKVLPIPQREIDITDGLIEQNEGYK
ncbi:RagB/SusD family nutrient uptake outer membrane protein [Marinilabiliaceae bacterium JC017]|nr:RagB/SusD family nutrient uptake outer membrane protein [Marinilabiliaceae bacterium JC017]